MLLASVLVSLVSAGSLATFEECMAPMLVADVNYFTPASSNYTFYSTGSKTRIDSQPAAIVLCHEERMIVMSVECSRKAELPPVPRSGGHSYEQLSSETGSIVVDIAAMNNVNVTIGQEPSMGTAKVQAGARLGHVYTQIFNQGGFTFNAGTCPSVGIGGHISGGGYGMTARFKGLAADQTIGMRVVLANGTLVDATRSVNSDLFWALRGGGAGSFGIITEFTINVFKVPEVSMFYLTFHGYEMSKTMSNATVNEQLLHSWMNYFPETSDPRLTTQINIGKLTTTFNGMYLGPLEELNKMLDDSGMLTHGAIVKDLRTDKCSLLGSHAFTWTQQCEDVSMVDHPIRISMEKKERTKIKAKYASKKLCRDGIQKVIGSIMNGPDGDADIGPWIQFEAYHGAFTNMSNDFTPWSHRDIMYSVQSYVKLNSSDLQYRTHSARLQWIYDFEQVFNPYSNNQSYQNYCDLDLGKDYGVMYWGSNFERLKEIKGRYDPLNVFRSAQSIPLP